MTLAAAFDVRRNAIAFLRHAFAIIVIVGHAWEVGGFGPDPLEHHAGVTLGQLGVHAFFVIGGFLVAGSFLNSGSWRTFFVNRALRILPGFWVCLVVTAAALCPLALRLGRPALVGTVEGPVPFFDYVAANFLLRIRQQSIGALFSHHPAAGVVNGSLWSIFPEALCYALLAVVGLLGVLRSPRRPWLVAAFVTAALAFSAHDHLLHALADSPLRPKVWYLLQLAGLGACFTGGALCWVYRSELRFSRRVRWLALAAASAAIALGAYRWFGPLVLPLAVIALATLIPWTTFDRFGDFSYGLYLYHYPIQQLLYGTQTAASGPLLFFAASLIATLPLAAASWFFVERPALRLKPKSLHRA